MTLLSKWLEKSGLGRLPGKSAIGLLPARDRVILAKKKAEAQRQVSQKDSIQQAQRYMGRLWFVILVFGILTTAVLGRLLSYQLAGRIEAAAASPARNPAARGHIIDTRGNVFAADRFEYEIRVAPNQLEEDDRRVIAKTMAAVLGRAAADIEQELIESAESGFLILKSNASFEIGQYLIGWKAQHEDGYPGIRHIEIAAIPRRYYPQKTIAAHVIGFVGLSNERTAHFGVEEYYATFLPANGVGLTEKSSRSFDELAPDVRRLVPSPAGRDIVLSLDRGIQWIIEDELYEGIRLYGAQSGSIIVMEPNTGAVLGLANWPTFDPNQYPTVHVSQFQNPTISAQYEPGSIFKVITMAAALDSGLIEPYSSFVDTGSRIVGGRVILNSNRTGTGAVTATETLALSINVVTAEIAERLGAERLYDYIRRFGFGQATEIDLANEIPGLIKTPNNPDWSLSDLGTNSFGQGIAVTPIQMANAVSAIANGGKLMRPYVVQSRIFDGFVQHTEPIVIHHAISQETATKLTNMMVQVVRKGATAAATQGYNVAGKTGTAQIPGPGGYIEDQTIVSFVGFGPVENPQFVILVKLDRPSTSEWATQTAAPVFSRVANRLFEYMGIPPQ